MTTAFLTHSRGATQSAKLEPPTSALDSFNMWTRSSPSQIAGDCQAAGTLSAAVPVGLRLFIHGWASAPGTLTITALTPRGFESDSAPVIAGETVQGLVSLAADATRCTATFTCGPDAASRVEFHMYAVS